MISRLNRPLQDKKVIWVVIWRLWPWYTTPRHIHWVSRDAEPVLESHKCVVCFAMGREIADICDVLDQSTVVFQRVDMTGAADAGPAGL